MTERNSHAGQTETPRRYRRQSLNGKPSKDPASSIMNIGPPNMGRPVIPHVLTFQAIHSMVAHSYRSLDEATKQSRQNAIIMRRDTTIMECLEARQRGTALLNWHLEPEDPKSNDQKDLCEQLTKILQRTPYFTEYRRSLQEALWFGRSGINNAYEKVNVEGKMRTVVGQKWKPINGDKLVFRYDTGDGKYDEDQIGIKVLNWKLGDVIAGNRIVEPTDWGMAYFLEPWERHLVTVHRHFVEDAAFEDPISAGSVHGVGIRSRIYWNWFFKNQAEQILMDYLQRSGTGIWVYYYPAHDARAKAEMEQIAQERTDSNVVLLPRTPGDPNMDAYGLERVEPNPAGLESFRTILHEYFNHNVKRYILGQTLTTEASGTGLGSGLSDLHLESFLSIIKYDASNLEESLTFWLNNSLKIWNFPQAATTWIRFKIDTEAADTEKRLAAVRQAWDMGAKIKSADVYDTIGFSAPSEDDEFLQSPSFQQQGMPGMPMGNQAMGFNPETDGPGGGGPTGANGEDLQDLLGPLASMASNGNAGDAGAESVKADSSEKSQYQRRRYHMDGIPAGPGDQRRRIGETKTVNGVTYRLNQNSRWERASDDEAGEGQPTGQQGNQPDQSEGPPLEERKAFAAANLSSDRHPKIVGGLMRAFQASSEFQSSGEYSTHRVNPEQAKQAYDWMKKLAGTEAPDGARIVDLGQGRLGYSSGAGAFVLQPPRSQMDGAEWSASYTVMTGPVARAMESGGGEVDLPATPPEPTGQTPPAAPAAPVQQQQQPQQQLPVGTPVPQPPAAPAPIQQQPQQQQPQQPASNQPIPVTPETRKSPHEMTRDEYEYSYGDARRHKAELKAAQAKGNVISDDVLEDYPELVPANERLKRRIAAGEEAREKTKAKTTAKPGYGPAGGAGDSALAVAGAANDSSTTEPTGDTLHPSRLADHAAKAESLGHADLARDLRALKMVHDELARGTAPKNSIARQTQEAIVANYGKALRGHEHYEAVTGEKGDYQPLYANAPPMKEKAKIGPSKFDGPTETPSDTQGDESAGQSESNILKFPGTAKPPKKPAQPKRTASEKKRTIEQTFDELSAIGYTLEGGESYDVDNATSRYRVKGPDGQTSVMSAAEIEGLLRTAGQNRSRQNEGRKNTPIPPKSPLRVKPQANPRNRRNRGDSGGDGDSEGLGGASVRNPRPPKQPPTPEALKQHAESHLREAGLPVTPEAVSALHQAIESGTLSSHRHIRGVLKSASRRREKGDLNAELHPHISQAVKLRQRHLNRNRPNDLINDAVKRAVADYDIPESDLRQAIDDLHGERYEQHADRERAKQAAYKAAGLTPAKISKMENSGQDYTSIPGFDAIARTLASEQPGLGLGAGYEGGESDDTDYAAALWEVLKEGPKRAPQKHELADEAARFLTSNPQLSPEEQEQLAMVPFKRDRLEWLVKRYTKGIAAQVDAAAKLADCPTESQSEAGNYRKGHVRIHGLDISIENEKGSRRRPEWPKLSAHYGYIKRTEGNDGDHVDVFIGPNPESELVFVVDQVTPYGMRGRPNNFDEHKCLIGYNTEADAKAAYLSNYTKNWKCGPITALTVGQFKAWLKDGNITMPIGEQVSRYAKKSKPAAAPGQRALDFANWDESKHPRVPEGSPHGGEFTSKDDKPFALKNDGPKWDKGSPDDLRAKQDKLFQTSGHRDQMDLFGGNAVPKELVNKEIGEGAKPQSDDTPEPPAAPEPLTTDNPRETAKKATKAELDAEYKFARKSAVQNAGEDLLGSARHKVNAWRTLEDAEKNGTAAELVTRDNLLRNEPHNLMAAADEAPVTAVAMHFAIKAFPPKPGYGARYKPTPEQARKDREDYVEAYRAIKAKAEELAKDEFDGSKALVELRSYVAETIKNLRIDNRYNPTANALTTTHKALQPRFGRVSKQVAEFEKGLTERYGEIELADQANEHAKDVIEGSSIAKTFDKQTTGRTKSDAFNPADLYVKKATRKGGPTPTISSASDAKAYMLDRMKIRGIQFGNSVTDDEREHHSKMATEAFVDLADTLGLPLEAVSQGGKLGIAFGARGKSGALAHYEPINNVINLTRKSGVGSLAHEWGHFFDHHAVIPGSSDVKRTMLELRSAWDKSGFDSRMTKAVHEAVRSGKISAKKKDYWLSTPEVFARTFERYVQYKLHQDDRENTYLSAVEAHGFWPNDEEIAKIAPAMDALFDAYRKENHPDHDHTKVKYRKRAGQPTRFAKDAHGHEHRGKGPGGGQFVSGPEGGNNGDSSAGKPASEPSHSEFNDMAIDRKAFKQWFSGSHVIDEDGSPLVVYHGSQSPEEFDSFDFGRAGQNYIEKTDESHEGFIHFTDSPQTAFMYAGVQEQKTGLEIGDREDGVFIPSNIYDDGQIRGVSGRSIKAENSNGRVYPVYLKFNNPLVIENAKHMQYGEIPELVTEAKLAGNDGIILKNPAWHSLHSNGGDEYIAFSGDQILPVSMVGEE